MSAKLVRLEDSALQSSMTTTFPLQCEVCVVKSTVIIVISMSVHVSVQHQLGTFVLLSGGLQRFVVNTVSGLHMPFKEESDMSACWSPNELS